MLRLLALGFVLLLGVPLSALATETPAAPARITITVDRDGYHQIGPNGWPEPVIMTVRNEGPGAITLMSSDPWTVRDAFGHRVFRPGALHATFTIEPGETYKARWDQQSTENLAEAVAHLSASHVGFRLAERAGEGTHTIAWDYWDESMGAFGSAAVAVAILEGLRERPGVS